MAAPKNKNIDDMNGRWVMDKKHSGSTDAILAFQGIGWLTRKAIGLATVTLVFKQYSAPPETDPKGSPIPHIDITQTATGGIKGTTENRTLDWAEREHSDWLFGTVKAKSRFTSVKKVIEEAGDDQKKKEDAGFLGEGWVDEVDGDVKVVQNWADNEGAGWVCWQLWGFSLVEGERWMTRRVVFRKKTSDEVLRSTLYYEWLDEGEKDGSLDVEY